MVAKSKPWHYKVSRRQRTPSSGVPEW